MKVSIVIPAHNEAEAIGQTIEAALAQNYADFEVIVVNNASTDTTPTIVQSYPKVRLVNENNKGLLFAREAGRRLAQGDIIANIDADCVPDPDWISRGLRYFDMPHIVAVTGPCDFYDGHFLFRISSLIFQAPLYKVVSVFLQLPFIRGGAILQGGNNLIRAKTLQKVGGYNTSLVFYGEDTNTAKRIATEGRVVYDPTFIIKTSARRFKNEGSFTTLFKYVYHFFKQILRPQNG